LSIALVDNFVVTSVPTTLSVLKEDSKYNNLLKL